MSEFNLSQGQFKGLFNDLKTQGGFTVNPGTGAPKKKGISVATEANEMRLDRTETSPGKLSEYHGDSDNQERFGRGASFGGWRSEGGDDFIDTPTVYPETPGGQARARNQMLKSNQIGSYHISRGATELNPFHPENQSMDVVSSDNSPAQQQIWKDMPRGSTKGKGKKMPLRGQSFS
jgi:hypothetical protein